MSDRLGLSTVLRGILGTNNVYYQPPDSVIMKYPAIVYSRDQIKRTDGDNLAYLLNTSYTVTVIDKNPDSSLVQKLAELPKCRFERHFVADNLNHDVFVIYY